MANCARNITIFSFFTFLLMFTAISPVYGGGGREQAVSKSVLSRADALIQQREYEEAIAVLTDFARNYPNRFDQAQERLRRIYRLREDFNNTADDLIEALLNDPGNDDKILALSTKLYSLEREDNPILVNFVSRTHELSLFNVSRDLLRRILERGGNLLTSGNAVAAMQTYATGMDIMRAEFFSSDYGTAIENEVIRETERINSMIAAFPAANSQVEALSAELTRAINSGDMTRITQAISRLMTGIDGLISLKNQLYTALASYERILDRLQVANPELRDRNHLAFLTVIINGRTGRDIQEGMLGAFDCSWRNSVGSNLDALAGFLERANTAALTAFKTREYQNVITALDRMESYYNLSGQFFDRHRQFFRDGPTIALLGSNILRVDINQFIELRALNEANNSLRQAANIAMRWNVDRTSLTRWQQGTITIAAAFTAEQQTRNAINTIQRDMGNVTARASQINTDMSVHHNVVHLTNTINEIENFQAMLLADELQSVQRYYTIAHISLQDNLNSRREEMERGRNFLNGERQTGDDVTSYYPTEALDVLTRMLASITTALEGSNTISAQYRNESPAVTSNNEVSAINVNYQTTVSEMNALRNQGLALADNARTRSTRAEAYRQEADRLLRESQTAFQRQDFDTARERLQRASDRINNSLELQASAALRTTWDAQLLSLGQAISRTENELIIAEVRNLVNSARTLYFAGNFQQAAENLTRARNRWRITNVEENEEVIYWLGIVDIALSARSGRVIPPTAPLYAEISQLLSQAQRNYEEGMRFINTGQRALGLAKFEEAQQMTREVRLMFPINQDAGILDLRIEQFTDPAAFNAAFEQRLRTAIAGTRQRSLEAYADLQNLAEINPRYPNMRAIMTQAEIDMGFRPPPPNPADIARSRELTASARRILDGNITALMETALAQIDEAITLNPDNIEATQIKDRLLNRTSVPSTIVLSREDEETYQRALRELQAGNNLVARALVDRLMQNPRNRTITKVIELQRRIQSIL